ncbi:MAG: hypothetical protein U0270_16480 [Labilithrix sp.]
MSFFYGDLTPAPFVANFLEELRDALDFAGGIAAADQTIVTADARRDELRRQADTEHARLDALAWAMIAAAGASDQGASGSASARLAAELGSIIHERRDAADASVRTKLEEDIGVLDAELLAARRDYFPTLQDWLLARVPPRSRQTWRVELVMGAKKDQHRHRAELAGESAIGLAWTIDLASPDDGPLAAPLRVHRLVEELAIVTPQVTGLIKKEIKNKKQRIDRHWVTAVVDDDDSIRIELRAELGEAEGFTITVGSPSAITLVKNGPVDDATVGAFPVAPEDEPALLALAARLRDAVRSLQKQRLASATFDGLPFDGVSVESQPKLVGIVARLVGSLASTVDEIASRSRSEEELVLRRSLEDGRREELFMPKARLREKLAVLDEPHRRLFADVERALSPKAPSAPLLKSAAPAEPTTRSEISQPEPPYVRRRSSGTMNAVVVPILKQRPPTYSSPTLEITSSEEEVDVEIVAAPAAAAEVVPDVVAEPAPVSTPLENGLAQARQAVAEGRLDDAFRQYGIVFGSSAFASMPLDAQRKALASMYFGDQPNVASADVKSAYRVTLPILQALVVQHRDPADYELLGMAYAVLDEPDQAKEIFRKALDAERARNPSSDRCATLMSRVSQL